MSVAKLARGREGYYLATVASGREDAGITQMGGLVEPEGLWLGQAAESLGLVGAVSGPALRALLSGVDPVTGEILFAHHDRVRVAAYDCTYSTPKSVSVLHALGPEDVGAQVRAGHEEATAAALGYLERRGARVRRTLDRGATRSALPAGGFAAAAFTHRASRAPDPHLHSHVLVANLAPGPDGRWSALDARGLYLELQAARDLYETQLRSELTRRLGVAWRELKGAWADLDGIDPSVSRAFSRRSVEIQAMLASTGRSGPRAARVASEQTRPAKDMETPYEELVTSWRERSYRLGVSDARLAAVTGRPGRTNMSEPADRWAARTLGEQGILARDGTCRRSELIRSRCASFPSGAGVDEVERDVDALIASGRVVAVATRSGSASSRRLRASSGRRIPGGVPELVYTTPEVVELNERLRRVVRDYPGTVTLLAYGPGERLAGLDAVGDLARDEGVRVAAMAPSRVAATSFESVTGIEATAIAAGPPPAVDGGIVVAAEAHRLGPWELSSLVESSLAAGGRVVLFAPASALETSLGSAAILAPHLAPHPPTRPLELRSATEREDRARETHDLAGREVVVVSSGPAARDEMVAMWHEGRAAGRRTVLVASDQAVVEGLRDAVTNVGGSPGDVVETRRLVYGPSSPGEPRIVSLGPLPASVKSSRLDSSVQVAVVPASSDELERLGRVAEVARPKYLTAQLGTVPARTGDRATWRSAAAAIETFRRNWSIADPERALGDPRAIRSLDTEALADMAATRLVVREAVRTLDKKGLALGRRAAEPHTRSR